MPEILRAATLNIRGELSQATTSMPRSARKRASTPVPHPISRIRSPARKLFLSSFQTESRCSRPITDDVNVESYCSAMLSKADEYAGFWFKDTCAGVTLPPQLRKRTNQRANLPLYSANRQSLQLQCPTFVSYARVQPRSVAVGRQIRRIGGSGALGYAHPCLN